MLWYRAEIGVSRNRKVLRLSDALDLSIRETVGLLHLFWSAVAEQSEYGIISDWKNSDILHVCMVQDDTDVMSALIEHGFVDEENGNLVVHGWLERNSRTLKERERLRVGYAKETQVQRVYGRTDRRTDVQTNRQAFDTIWKQYPRKIGKAKAWKCWERNIKAGVQAEKMEAAIRHYAEACNGSEKRFIKHPATFLGPDEHWRDWVNGIPESERPEKKMDGMAILIQREEEEERNARQENI